MCKPGDAAFVEPVGVCYNDGLFRHRAMNELELIYTPIRPAGPAGVFSLRLDDRDTDGSAEPRCLLDTDGGHVLVAGRPSDRPVAALVYPSDTPREMIAGLALRHARFRSGVEKLLAIYKTARFVASGALEVSLPSSPPGDVPRSLLSTYSDILGREASVEFLLKLLRVAEWDSRDVVAMHELRLDVDHIQTLIGASARERRALLHLYASGPITVAQGRKLARWLLFLRGNKTFDLDSWTAEVTRDGGVHAGGAALIDSLRRAAQPTLSARLDRIDAALKHLKLPPSVNIAAPENLEGEAFSCYFRFSRTGDLEGIVELLRARIADGSIADLIDLLHGEEE